MSAKQLENLCWKACYHNGDLEIVKDCVSKGLDI